MRTDSLAPAAVKKDRCARPTEIVYNSNYNPHEPPPDTSRDNYSPYDAREPLYDNRPIIVSHLPKGHTATGAAKKPRTSWL
jgi:hypothetical protein